MPGLSLALQTPTTSVTRNSLLVGTGALSILDLLSAPMEDSLSLGSLARAPSVEVSSVML